MRKKGVSNLISAVLLIMIALGLASVLYGWSTGWVTLQLERVKQVSQGEFAAEVATLDTVHNTYVLIVRNVGTEDIKIRDNGGNRLIALYVTGNDPVTTAITTTFGSITDQTDATNNLSLAGAVLPPDHVMQINYTPPITITAGNTYEVMLTLSDGTPLIVAVTAG